MPEQVANEAAPGRVEVWTGSKHLVGSGVLYGFGDSPIDLDIFVNGDRGHVHFRFLQDDGIGRIVSVLADGANIELRCFNLTHHRLGAGPALLGTIGEHAIYLAYEIEPLALGTGRRISYTVWEGPNQEGGGAGMEGWNRGNA